MAHLQQKRFVSLVIETFLGRHLHESPPLNVLEVGSYDVNGSLRGMFSGCDYTGIDLVEGPGVDRVVKPGDPIGPQQTGRMEGSMDVVISCECFEHNPFWAKSFSDMHLMTKPGGLVVVTCATKGRVEHGTRRMEPYRSPGTQAVGSDYYRNLDRQDFLSQFSLDDMFGRHEFFSIRNSHDLYFIGEKTGTPLFKGDWEKLRAGVDEIRRIRTSDSLPFVLWMMRRLLLEVIRAILSDAKYQDLVHFYLKKTAALRDRK